MTRPLARPTTWTVLLAAAVLGLAAAPLPSAHAAATPTCDGRPATLVGTPGHGVHGTSGDDVIVTDGADVVHTGGGTDLVCTTDTGRKGVGVFAESAGVTIDSSGDDHGVRAFLYGGDTFIGSPYDDGVDESNAQSSAHEIISTGAGNDAVDAGGVNQRLPDDTSVDLGSGDDVLFAYGPLGPDASFAGGSGTNRLYLTDGWDVDLAQHRLTEILPAGQEGGDGDAPVSVPLSGFTWVEDENYGAPFSVEGTRAAETIRSGDYYEHPHLAGPVTIHAGGGDDHVTVFAGLRGSVDGGRGRDTLTYLGDVGDDDHLVADLAHHRLTTGGETLHATGIERYAVVAAAFATVTGTRGPDHLRVDACRATVRSLAGADTLHLSHPVYQGSDGSRPSQCVGSHEMPLRMHADAGPGNDRIVGTRNRDVLLGGPGHDRVDGGAGRDVCRAEVTRRCP